MEINLNELDIKIKKKVYFSTAMIFSYLGEDYYYKSNKTISNIYNELIAEKIANRLGVPCCEYYLGSYNESLGTISKMFSKENYFSMSDLLISNYGVTKNKNNLKDISAMFDETFPKDVSDKLKQDLLDIFLFDALIGNCDRNTDNYGLIVDGNPRFAPLFDNENMLSDYSIYYGNYTLGIDKNDDEEENILYKLLEDNDEASERLERMLPVISDESLEYIFYELEWEYYINPYLKDEILTKFRINRNMLEECINRKVKKREMYG